MDSGTKFAGHTLVHFMILCNVGAKPLFKLARRLEFSSKGNIVNISLALLVRARAHSTRWYQMYTTYRTCIAGMWVHFTLTPFTLIYSGLEIRNPLWFVRSYLDYSSCHFLQHSPTCRWSYSTFTREALYSFSDARWHGPKNKRLYYEGVPDRIFSCPHYYWFAGQFSVIYIS